MLGMIVVEDTPGYLPPAVAAAPELSLILGHYSEPLLHTITLSAEKRCISAGGSIASCHRRVPP